MTGEDVRALVEREINGDFSLTNAHGCDLRRRLVSPTLLEYDDPRSGRPMTEPPPIIWLWLVLEESPEDRSGYKIVFDQEAGMYGLAVPGSSRDVFIGYYGSFQETYAGM